MSRIKSNLTGDVFEAPAADFANEADFTIVDPSTPITTTDVPLVAASAAGESVTSASAPVAQDSSGSTAAPAGTLSLDPTPIQTSEPLTTSSAAALDLSTTAATSTPDGTAPSVQGDLGNAAGASGAPDATSATVASAGSAPVDLGNVSPIVTDSPTTLTTEPQPVATSAIDTTAATADASSSQSTMSASSPGTDLPNDGAATSPAVTAMPADASLGSDVGNAPAALSPSTSDGVSGTASSTVSGAGDAPATGEAGNAQGAATPLDASAGGSPVSDTASADAASRVTTVNAAGILDVKSRHIVADQLESDALFAIANLATVTDNLKHAADAFFTAVHSQIDAEAAS